eukprot:10484218-Heterocapsa_arctica.AAC.1
MQRQVGGLSDAGHTIRHRPEHSDRELCGDEGTHKLQGLDNTREDRQVQRLAGNDGADGEKGSGSNGSFED